MFFNKDKKEIFKYLRKEAKRQKSEVNLIASENFVSKDVLKACGHPIQNKYAEGYSGRRYYMGCEYVDKIEDKCKELVCELFHAKYANVQAHSGSSANLAVYMACCKYWSLKPNEVIGIGFDLASGGHLTHFNSPTISGQLFNSKTYGLDKAGNIDYKTIEDLLKQYKDKHVILSLGYSAYSHKIDYKRLSNFIKKNHIKCFIVHDISHIAGLVVTGLYPNPLDYNWGESVSIITSTTHKTLRCARHAIIATNFEPLAKKINQAVFPYLQGGPLENMIAGVAMGLSEAKTKKFKKYQEQILKNVQAMIKGISEANKDIKFIGNGSDNHLCLVDLRDTNISGKEAELLLKNNNIVCNRNTIPGDLPSNPNGIRLGSAFMTSRGWKEKQFYKIGLKIGKILLKVEK